MNKDYIVYNAETGEITKLVNCSEETKNIHAEKNEEILEYIPQTISVLNPENPEGEKINVIATDEHMKIDIKTKTIAFKPLPSIAELKQQLQARKREDLIQQRMNQILRKQAIAELKIEGKL